MVGEAFDGGVLEEQSRRQFSEVAGEEVHDLGTAERVHAEVLERLPVPEVLLLALEHLREDTPEVGARPLGRLLAGPLGERHPVLRHTGRVGLDDQRLPLPGTQCVPQRGEALAGIDRADPQGQEGPSVPFVRDGADPSPVAPVEDRHGESGTAAPPPGVRVLDGGGSRVVGLAGRRDERGGRGEEDAEVGPFPFRFQGRQQGAGTGRLRLQHLGELFLGHPGQ